MNLFFGLINILVTLRSTIITLLSTPSLLSIFISPSSIPTLSSIPTKVGISIYNAKDPRFHGDADGGGFYNYYNHFYESGGLQTA